MGLDVSAMDGGKTLTLHPALGGAVLGQGRLAAGDVRGQLWWAIVHDVNARGRLDIPLEQQWFTPLHEAAQTGDVEMARLLLGLGADPNIRSEWGATPLESARQHGREAVAQLLEHPDQADLIGSA